jgi:hypothetical protein
MSPSELLEGLSDDEGKSKRQKQRFRRERCRAVDESAFHEADAARPNRLDGSAAMEMSREWIERNGIDVEDETPEDVYDLTGRIVNA